MPVGIPGREGEQGPALCGQVGPVGAAQPGERLQLEVGPTDAELARIAMKSRAQSDADLIVANTLEGKDAVAFIGDRAGGFERVERELLARRLLDRINELK